MSREVFDTLKKLAVRIKTVIDEEAVKGTLKPEEEVCTRWKVTDFQYTDRGITAHSAHAESFTKPSWLRPSMKILGEVKKSDEFSRPVEQLGKIHNSSHGLEQFIRKLVDLYLTGPNVGDADVDTVISTFEKELSGEPVKFGATVELQGVVLRPESMKIADGVILRKSRVEDLEKEFPAYSFGFGTQLLRTPSAILNIEFLGRQAMETQKRIEQAVAILRLFKVGSVKYDAYEMYSDSLTDIMAHSRLDYGRNSFALETFLITEEDEHKIKKFWRRMSDSIPESFLESGTSKVEYTTNAYNRYSDALLQNGMIERRIANAIMGLEALYFKPAGEMQELAYRLRIRAGKLLGLLGYNPQEVKERISHAYDIRSTFLHGGHLDYKQKRRIELVYKDIENLLLPILDYLRVSIIISILTPKEKDEFIDLIDDSLIDRNKETFLISVISGAKSLLSE